MSVEENKGQLIMSKNCLRDLSPGEKVFYNIIPLKDQTSLRHAALVLRRMILEHTENSESLPWPPTVESLEKRLASTPELLMKFFKSILEQKHTHKVTTETAAQFA